MRQQQFQLSRLFAVVIALVRTNYSSAFGSSPLLVPLLRRSTRLGYASTERSSIELIDPETGCEVVLIGCFHGSPSSANDVEREILAVPHPDAIVLELCASRFADLRRAADNSTMEAKDTNTPPRLIRFLQVVRDTARTKGLSTGVATGILGGVSGLQTALSGFTPGLEFTTALELSQQQQQSTTNPKHCDIILADQVVDVTIEKVGKVPRLAQNMMEEVLSCSTSLEQTQWGQMAAALQTALVGNPTLGSQYQINVGQVMTRNMAVILELSRLLFPPILLTQIALTVVNEFIFPLPQEQGETMMTMITDEGVQPMVPLIPSPLAIDPLAYALDALPHVAILTFMLTFSYSFLAVPVTKVILAERDDQLTRGIQAACRLAKKDSNASSQQQSPDNDSSPGRVVAVLGLLHLNGVAQRLLNSIPIEEDVDVSSSIGVATENRIQSDV
ncbi:expressed unknown protein [Seminavis robusta]|uniref:Uncharacterized protein n=1 Tax=Seminavis robusta TaxID=568900 RepID=A0A9N8DAW4_9STRA|nr:expressed unknown protein [Seminavis robusta]|eukprot:Sro15_g010890.1 n/a (446) ;mRNA; r:18887-20224